MGRPTPVIGSAARINEQSNTIREQYRLIQQLKNEKAQMIKLIARALHDMNHHACLTDETLRIMKRVHEEEMGA